MKRISASLVFVLLCVAISADAQPTGKVRRIGYLSSLSATGGAPMFDAVRQGLRDLGYVEGRTIIIEARWADGNYERLPALATELVSLNPELIVSAGGPPPARALKSITSNIPVVFISGSAMAAGIVSNLGRPGANLTGLEVFAEELDTKRLELLKELLGKPARIAVLWNPGNQGRRQRQELESSAQAQGMDLRFVEAKRPSDLEPAFARIRQERVDAILLCADPMFTSEYRRVVALVTQTRLPAMHPFRSEAEVGGLISYGTDLFAVYRNAAIYVDRILTGTKPAELPVQQPTRFELVINLKTARELGLTIPLPLMLRADHLIR
jgi:putative ABC transport system substrate-binding protein